MEINIWRGEVESCLESALNIYWITAIYVCLSVPNICFQLRQFQSLMRFRLIAITLSN